MDVLVEISIISSRRNRIFLIAFFLVQRDIRLTHCLDLRALPGQETAF